jgi:hypothetical protein
MESQEVEARSVASFHRLSFITQAGGTVEKRRANVVSSVARGLPGLDIADIGGTIEIVGGGHSLRDTLEDLRASPNWIFAVNGAHDWLLDQGIVPHAQVLADVDKHCVSYVQKPHRDVTYLVASQCHPAVFDALQGFNVKIWHCASDDPSILPKELQPQIYGGSSVAMRVLHIGMLLGVKSFGMWGIDCSYREGAPTHIYEDKESLDGLDMIEVRVGAEGRTFESTPHWAIQVQNMTDFLKVFGGVKVTPHGEGLMQEALRIWYGKERWARINA